MLSIFESKENFQLKSLLCIIDIPYKVFNEEKIYDIFGFFDEKLSHSESLVFAYFINKISGKIYTSEGFLNYFPRFVSSMSPHTFSYYYTDFRNSLISYMESLSDLELSNPKALKFARDLAISGYISKSLATRILNIHIKFEITDHNSFLYLHRYHNDPHFFEVIKNKLLTEVIK